MADYINSNILCQAYIHIDPVVIDDSRLEALREELELFLSTRGRFFLYDAVESSVEFKDGSLKVYAGIAGAIYIAIGQYGSFRSGVDYLAQDTKRLAEVIISETLFLSRSKHANTIRVESRPGVVGSLKSLLDKIQSTRENITNVSLAVTINKLDEIEDEIDRLLGNLKDEKDVKYVASEVHDYFKELFPKKPPSKPGEPHDLELVAIYEKRRNGIIVITKSAGEGTLKPIGKKKRRGKSKNHK